MNKNLFMSEQEIEIGNKNAKSACIILINPNGDQSILAMTRKSDFHDIGFPGGKLEDGESALDAAVRECYEETGILVEKESLVPVHCAVAKTSVCFTFLASKMCGGALLPKSREGMPMWINMHMMLKDTCTYKKYNLNCVTKLISKGIIQNTFIEKKKQ